MPKAAEILPAIKSALVKLPKLDGWENLLSGLGVRNRDGAVSTTFGPRLPLSIDQCGWLHRQDWACGRVVDDLAHDATRAGFALEVKDDTDTGKEVEQLWDDYGVANILQSGFRWALVYGGAVGVILTDDRPKAQESKSVLAFPLIPGTYKKIVQVVIVERQWATPNMGDIDLTPGSPNYGLPRTYFVTPQLGAGSPVWIVHWTRIVRFDGVPVDSQTRLANLSYNDSIYERPYAAVQSRGGAIGATSSIVQRFTQGVLSMPGLMESLVSDREGDIIVRLRSFALGLGATSTAVIDGEHEKYELMGQPVSGLEGLLGELRMELAGSLSYPMARLYGAQAGALASAEADEKLWASTVHGWQKLRVVPALEFLTSVILGARGAPAVTNWQIKPKPIAAPNAKLDAEVRKINAETDVLYVQGGVLEPVEIRDSRFAGAEYGQSITLDPKISAAIASGQAAAMATEVQTPEPPTEPTPPPDAAAGAADFGGVA